MTQNEFVKVDFTKPVKTREGREARVYATDGSGEFPVHGAVKYEKGWGLAEWKENGQHCTRVGCGDELVNVPEEVTEDLWLEFYHNGQADVFHTEAAARIYKASAIAIKKITVTYTKGEGL
jgi:hypothetical protein